MSTKRVSTPARGESLVNIEPALLQQVSGVWRHRMSLYTGRALTETALKAEQQYRSGRLVTLSQSVTQGVGAGLDTHVDSAGNIRVLAGYGFTAVGDDVTLIRELNTTLDQLPVVNAITGVPLTAGDSPVKTLADVKKDGVIKGGVYVLLLMPVTGRATGEEIDQNKGPNEVSGMLDSSCTRDPEEYAFEDWEMVDGAQLALASWPDQPSSLKLPDSNPAATWRNRIAYTVFNAEMQLGPDDYLPWQGLGVALGVLAFDPAWTTLFFDHNSVLRSGGRAREPQVLTQADSYVQISRATAEARLLQLMEQNAQIASQADFAAYLALPPTAILPVASLDLVKRQNLWFPKTWKLHVAPIHAEEVETALRAQIFAAPFDLTQPEEADLLLPLTDDVYDPDVLVVETLAQVFIDELQKATDQRDKTVQHRFFLQSEANALLKEEGKPALDTSAGLSEDELNAAKTPYTPPADGSESYGTIKNADGSFQSAEVKKLLDEAAAAPYTVKLSNGNPLPLFTPDDLGTLTNQGIQAFVDRMNTRIDKIDDLLNINFLQTQTNIYRYRTNVLHASDASRLVTSPIIANIAQRESAVATAEDLSAYIQSLKTTSEPPPPPAAPPGGPPAAGTPPRGVTIGPPPVHLPASIGGPRIGPAFVAPNINVLRNLTVGTLGVRPLTIAPSVTVGRPLISPAASPTVTHIQPLQLATGPSTIFHSTPVQASTAAISALPSKGNLPTEKDISAQLPLAGIPFNLRTLSIAERLKTAPSHEALLYSLSARTSFLDAVLADNLGISIEDLEILVMEEAKDAQGNTIFQPKTYSLWELRNPDTRVKAYGSVQQAGLFPNSDESSVFSAGIGVLEHHTLLMRAVEARIALYRQFISLACQALTAVQKSETTILAAIKKVENDLAQARANFILVTGLVNDEKARIAAVNQRRNAILANVPFIVLMRRRTLETEADVPSRQLVPANVESPVPAALQSTAIVPPELRELSSLLREAPLAWIPAVGPLLARLEHPRYFIDIAQYMQVRAYTRTQLPVLVSSATSHPGAYGQPIADVFYSQQTAMFSIIQQRANYNFGPFYQMSWAAQMAEIYRVAAINDLLAAETVHLEISREIAALVENVAKIATALYIRVSATLPADRLQWAEYLRGVGRHLNMRYLTILPGWQTQDYIARQQMQLLVDWLFGQIDTGIPDAVAYMSDLIRTAVLLASHAPVNDILAGEVAVRTKPVIGGLVPLTSDSSRVSRGMPVMLYQGTSLLARGVVHDIDPHHSYAKISHVYQEETYLEASAKVHFLNDQPEKMLVTHASLARR